MKSFRFILLLSASVLLGAIVSEIITMTTWNIRIEDKAFHCWDIGFGSYWTDINSHASAGDAISSGWTWEKLKQVRLNYIETFWLLWVAISLIAFLISHKLWPGTSPSPTALDAGGSIFGRQASMRIFLFCGTMLLVVSGCASDRSSPTEAEVRQKRYQAEALEGELVVQIRELDKLEKAIDAAPNSRPLKEQARDLDRRIQVIKKAKAEVVSQLKEMEARVTPLF